MKKLLSIIIMVVLLIATLSNTLIFALDKKPGVIRIGSAFTAGSSNPYSLQTIGIVHQQGLLEDEFKKDGIKVEWIFFKGVSPALNEAFANNSIDIGATSELGAIIARANGLKIKLISGLSRNGNSYVAVPTGSPITRFEDLKGKKFATANATNFQLAFERIAQFKGLTSKDFKYYNLGPADGVAALASNNIDGALYGTQLFAPRNAGKIKIIYSTKEQFPDKWKSQSGIFVTESFAKAYPQITRRFVKVFLKAAQWSSNENNREAFFLAGSKTGTPIENLREDAEGSKLVETNSPLLDDFVIGHYKDTITLVKDLDLIKDGFDVKELVDKTYLEATLKELRLTSFWTSYDVEGKIVNRK